MGIYPVPSQAELINLLDYNQWAGTLTWRRRDNASFNGKHAGKHAGTISVGRSDGSNRYLKVGVGYRQYPAHRLVWMIMTGEQPPDVIDHKDGNPFNLRWENLRAATNGQNIQNSKLRKDNKTGFKGVSLRIRGNCRRYRAQITAGGRHLIIGDFKTAEAAAAARATMAEKLHGEFARAS